MVSDIIDGLSRTLYENFEGVTIYVDNVEQHFEAPAFFICNIRASETRLLGNRAKRNYTFTIDYISKSNTNKELQSVASKLYVALRQIKLIDGSGLNGLRLKHDVIGGVLHFTVHYNPIVYYPQVEPEVMVDFDYNLNEVK